MKTLDKGTMKMAKVIDSCKTKEQLLTATQYCKLWMDKHAFNEHDYHVGIKLTTRYEFMLNRIIKKMATL